LREHEITLQVQRNLILENADQGILQSSFEISMRENNDANAYNDIEWQVLGVYMVKGWRYTPNPDIQLPMNYSDHWIGGGWDADATVGGQKAIRVG
jgi:hypothetical protein